MRKWRIIDYQLGKVIAFCFSKTDATFIFDCITSANKSDTSRYSILEDILIEEE